MSDLLLTNESRTTRQLMLLVCLGLLPGAIAQFHFFGWGVLINFLLCSLYAISAESLMLMLRGRKVINTIKDNSALLTGLLLALALPPLLPWWMSLVGVFFAIIIAKHLYGGLGSNPFNPAMIGYLVLLISFPLAMTNWLPNQQLLNITPSFIQSLELTFTGFTSDSTGTALTISDIRQLVDGYTMATPLDEIKNNLSQGFMISEIKTMDNYTANANSWQWINLAYLIGGLYLLLFKLVRWHIPISILISMTVTALLISVIGEQSYLSPNDHLLLGATMFSTFFIATDPVSAATTQKGRIIYGALIGFTVVIIRTFGSYPDAFAFAIILLNIASPTIDYYFRPKVYGENIAIKIIDDNDD